MNKQLIAKTFNTQLMAFIKQVCEMYPQNKDLKLLRTQLRLVITSSKSMAIDNYKIHVVDVYGKEIFSKNDKFFLNLDLAGTPIAHLGQLKQIYVSATQNTKDNLWKYIMLLSKLAQKY